MNKKIVTRIVSTIVLCSVLTAVIIGAASMIKATLIIKKESGDKLLNMVSSKGNEYSIQTTKLENTVNELASIVSNGIDSSKAYNGTYMKQYENSMTSLLKSLGSSNKSIIGLYVNFDPKFTGTVKAYDMGYEYDEKNNTRDVRLDLYSLEDYKEDNEEMSWYYSPIKTGKGVWSKPYVDSVRGINLISYTTPIYINNVLIGVAGADMSFEDLKSLIINIKAYDSGSAFLLSNDFTFIVDRNIKADSKITTMENGKYKNIAERMKKNKSSIIQSDFQGKNSLIGYYTMDNGEILGIAVPSSEVFKSLTNTLYIILLVIILGILVSTAIGAYIGGKISRPIETATDLIIKMAGLDLTKSDENINRVVSCKNEIGVMGINLELLRSELLKTIEMIKGYSGKLLQYGDSIINSSKETSTFISVISKTTNGLAEGAVKQVEKTQCGLYKLNQLAEEIEKVEAGISVLDNYSMEMTLMKEQGNKSMRFLKENLDKSTDASVKVSRSIDELWDKSNFLGKIIDTINSFGKQTHLLAINASIEAARAGERGKSFSVLASQIKKLSESTISATKEIDTLLQKIHQEISLSKSDMDAAKIIVDDVNSSMKEFEQCFEFIGTTAASITMRVRELVQSISKVNEDKNNILHSIKEISVITEEASASSEEIAATITDQENEIKNIFITVEKIRLLSETLDNMVQRFNII